MISIPNPIKFKAFITILWMTQHQYLADCQNFEELGISLHGKMLTNHVKESLNTTAGLGDCFMTCAVREFCVSINYHQMTSACDLNDATDKAETADMRNTSLVIYMTYPLRQPVISKEWSRFHAPRVYRIKTLYSYRAVQMWSRALSGAEVSSLASDRCADPLVGNLIQWSDLLAKRYGQVTIKHEPCQGVLVFPRKSTEDKVFWLNPFSPLQVFSLSLWVLADSSTDRHGVFHYISQQNREEIAVHLWSSNNNIFYIRQNSLKYRGSLIDNKWHHIAMTWDSSNSGQLFVYVDGVQRGAKNVAAGQTIPPIGALYLGQVNEVHDGSSPGRDAFQGQLTKHLTRCAYMQKLSQKGSMRYVLLKEP
ncbi:Pentraxin-4 [Exaiptasia diaphana]|nr:Pentraxin-4 [Exaiptasia diaphana]